MDLQQDKLTKSEWESIEIPVIQAEKDIFNLIIKGYHTVDICINNSQSIFGFLKLSDTETIHNYIFMKYLQPLLVAIFRKYKTKYNLQELNTKSLSKSDIIRFEHMEKNLFEKKQFIIEYIFIDYMENILKYNEKDEQKQLLYIYTIKVIIKNSIRHINKHLLEVIDKMINYFDDDLNKLTVISNSKAIIINNKDLTLYGDQKLYVHQKELFTRMKDSIPKIIFYVAPTGTGKTLSPLGLSENYKIIFVCAVRHVGLALAKAAISMEKCVAFAFGCTDIDDIRLHYFSAKEYTKNRKTGGIFRVDNSVGDKVQIMICDIQSYLYAMRYMLAFNKRESLVLYWDEPTISLDYEEHSFHKIIKNNWCKNVIGNIVLSSATLPMMEEMRDTISDYKSRFGGDVHCIKNYDCSKSISIVNRDGYVEAPHYISNDYTKVLNTAVYIDSNKTLLRYVDLDECISFIEYVNKKKIYRKDVFNVDNYFVEIEDITIDSIKIYYLILLKNIIPEEWKKVYIFLTKKRVRKYESTAYITTRDAYTLVNGPTIYLTNDIDKIAVFCIQNMKFPDNIIKNISDTIAKNGEINKKIAILEKNYEDGLNKEDMKDNKLANDRGIPNELRQLKSKIESFKNMIRTVSLDDMYIPNKKDHLRKWGHAGVNNAFSADISDYVVERIMLIDDMDDIWKLLLLMGIGVFSTHTSSQYTEIMKDLAKSKKLYLIIASSDYIYGTNYQFDHCYVGKDLLNMTQEKIIQALGRVGRNKISDEYTIRFRDNELLTRLFTFEPDKMEVINMQKLFTSWKEESEEEIEDLY